MYSAIVYLIAGLQIASIVYALVLLTRLARNSARQTDILEKIGRLLEHQGKN